MNTIYRMGLETDIIENLNVLAEPEPDWTYIQSLWQCGQAGTMTVRDYSMGGFTLSELVGNLTLPLELSSRENQGPWVGMMYQLDGQIHSSMDQRPVSVPTKRHNLIFEECDNSRHLFVPGERFHAFHIMMDPVFFEQLVVNNTEWTGFYDHFLNRREPFRALRESIVHSDQTLGLIQQILSCPFGGTLKKMFLEARFLDLFVEQQNQYQQVSQSRLARRDVDLFYAIRDFLDQNYQNPPSLLTLARQFGTNDFKLKKGFKELFGTTVFGYVAQKRLTTAHHLLQATQASVQEVSELVGFSNAAHFATAFRRQFGHTPSQVKR
ncbi:helix-turn-helix transcriptional regulator [Larkinella insperata]|uniref:Helix-turn-helix transcriptional regulator n=1 Tax=Larkinella insperata TaxID=332158 RepID=A0ABW3Q6R7_9BACT|nr:AraC family transcriptional regulator [Larkinella insperata]